MFRGTLDDFTLPEIVRMLAFSKKTGTLQVSRRAGGGRISFREGAVVYAETELSGSRLGQRLLATGRLSPTVLRQALDTQATTGERLGHILLQTGAISRDDLQDAIRSQVEEAAFELMCWEAGEFGWEPGAAQADEAEVALDVDDLMLDVSNRLREQDEMRRRLGSPGAVPRLVPHPAQGPGDINITPQQWRVLVLVDSRRTVEELAAAAGLSESDTATALNDLVIGGLVEIGAVAPVPAPVAAESNGTLPVPAAQPDEAVAAAQRAFAAAPGGPPVALDATPPEEWFEDPDFDAGPGKEDPDAASAPEDPERMSVAFPPPEPDVEDLPRVDRAAAVRELSGLFDEPKVSARPAPPPPEPKRSGSTEAATAAKGLIARFARKPSE